MSQQNTPLHHSTARRSLFGACLGLVASIAPSTVAIAAPVSGAAPGAAPDAAPGVGLGSGPKAAAAAGPASTATGAPQPGSPRVAYWDNWTDTHGVSHLTKCNFTDFKLRLVVPEADKEWLGHPMQGSAIVVTNVQPAHWRGGWHENPRVQWVVPTSGTLFMQAMDSTRVELNPGDALLGEDLHTVRDKAGHSGHLSGNIGDAPVTLLITQFADARPAHVPCPVK